MNNNKTGIRLRLDRNKIIIYAVIVILIIGIAGLTLSRASPAFSYASTMASLDSGSNNMTTTSDDNMIIVESGVGDQGDGGNQREVEAIPG